MSPASLRQRATNILWSQVVQSNKPFQNSATQQFQSMKRPNMPLAPWIPLRRFGSSHVFKFPARQYCQNRHHGKDDSPRCVVSLCRKAGTAPCSLYPAGAVGVLRCAACAPRSPSCAERRTALEYAAAAQGDSTSAGGFAAAIRQAGSCTQTHASVMLVAGLRMGS
jgi:hypothetical protein